MVRIGLVGCVKKKLKTAAPLKDLYLSLLFRGRRAYVEKTCDCWFILSAKYYLAVPDEVGDPYDLSVKDLSASLRREWSSRVLEGIDARLGDVAGKVFEIHAGKEYREYGLVQGLRSRGAQVTIPLEHLGIGEQLAFYARYLGR